MKQRPRIYYSDTQKSLMWDRWEKGESVGGTGRLEAAPENEPAPALSVCNLRCKKSGFSYT